MSKSFMLRKSVQVNAPVESVWKALTDPELIKIYFFGTECITDWKKGSSMLFRGTWEGKAYEDKANILDIREGKFIEYNYWSAFSGTSDSPENYSVIRYELTNSANSTIVTVIQKDFKTLESMQHSENNWGMVLEGLKKLVEK